MVESTSPLLLIHDQGVPIIGRRYSGGTGSDLVARYGVSYPISRLTASVVSVSSVGYYPAPAVFRSPARFGAPPSHGRGLPRPLQGLARYNYPPPPLPIGG